MIIIIIMIIIIFIWKHHHFILPKSNFITNSLRAPLHLCKEGIVSRMHRVTCGISPGKKWRLIPWLIPRTKYIACSSYKRTIIFLIKYAIFCCWKRRALRILVTLLWVPTIPKAPILRLTKFPFSNLFSRDFNFFIFVSFPFRVKIYVGFKANS